MIDTPRFFRKDSPKTSKQYGAFAALRQKQTLKKEVLLRKKPNGTKRALALSGGGPVVGLEIGALKAFEEKGIDFDVYACACVGSWVGCLYNSLPPESDRIARLEHVFRDQIFIPDDIYESFPICYKVFRMDYLNDYKKLMEKLYDPKTYQNLFLPHRIWQYAVDCFTHPPVTRDDLFYRISEGMALHPSIRLMTELHYKLNKSGIAGLISSGGFVEKFIDFEQLFRSEKIVYLNAYNLSRNEIEIFINRHENDYNDIDADALMAGSSVLHYTENRTIDGEKYKYCEGAVIDTVNLDHLLEDHPDLDEIWVIKIADYKSVKPPKNLIESSLVGVMLPFDTISDDDIRIFSYKLREFNREKDKNIRFVNVKMRYGDLTYHWNQANLSRGIEVGYQGAMTAINELESRNFDICDMPNSQVLI